MELVLLVLVFVWKLEEDSRIDEVEGLDLELSLVSPHAVPSVLAFVHGLHWIAFDVEVDLDLEFELDAVFVVELDLDFELDAAFNLDLDLDWEFGDLGKGFVPELDDVDLGIE